MTRFLLALLLCACLRGAADPQDLAQIKTEPNLEKRAEKALAFARDALEAAQTAYNEQGDLKKADAALVELGDAVELANESLVATGKNPSKKPKHFKRAEIKTRELMRRLDDFRAQMGADERGVVEQIRERVRKIHDSLLEGIMGGKKR